MSVALAPLPRLRASHNEGSGAVCGGVGRARRTLASGESHWQEKAMRLRAEAARSAAEAVGGGVGVGVGCGGAAAW